MKPCEQAQAECLSLWQANIRELLKDSPGAFPFFATGSANALEVLIAFVGLLLLLVSVNIAGLMLVRATARRLEIAVRLAVGGTRTRLIRQMLTESLPLAAAGAIGGLLLALALIPLAVRALPPIRDRNASLERFAIDAGVDHRVLIFALAASAIALIVFGLVPALSISRTSLDSILRGVRSSGGGRARQILAAIQIALCTFLLAGA
ncbi:MAG TPA: FtsX-like permease family protein, partial [Bryobacteraceae bacterium]|nr:FtsX-like permease family protein [Bryobacteraceae bacterium]